MKILIIEDEIKTAKALGRLIEEVVPNALILHYIESVSLAVDYLLNNESPDVIFMDIQLSDGTSFEIFGQVDIRVPIVFCTAFDEYALDAFRNNGVDYILKPFEKSDVQIAFNKIENLKNYFQPHSMLKNDFEQMLTDLKYNRGKTNFLIYINNKYVNVPTEKIAYFYSQFGGTFLVTFDQKEYAISPSLDEIGQLLSQRIFYRINRQYVLNFTAIVEISHFFSRKLLVKLTIPTSEKLLVSKDRVKGFLHWLEDR